MWKKKVFTASVFVAGGTMAAVSWANSPPPPVNQNIGIPDGVFNNLEEENCRFCHENSDITNPGYLPDRHHLHVGTTIQDPTAAPNGIPGDTYECLSCHELQWNEQTMAYEIVSFRDCLHCHQQSARQATVHHLTAKERTLNNLDIFLALCSASYT